MALIDVGKHCINAKRGQRLSIALREEDLVEGKVFVAIFCFLSCWLVSSPRLLPLLMTLLISELEAPDSDVD